MADVMNGGATVSSSVCNASETAATGASAPSSAQSTPRGEKQSAAAASASALMASAAKKKYLHSLSAEVTTTTTANGHSNGTARLGSGTSASPGSASGRSSTSSLNAVGASGSSSTARSGVATTAAKANGGGSGLPSSSSSSTSPAKQKRESRKVSINPAVSTMAASHSPRPNSTLSKDRLSSASTTNIKDAVAMSATLSNCAASTASHRTSLVHISAEKRARKVRFFINNDKFFKGAVIAVSAEKFRTFEKLLEHLTRIMCNQVTLPNGVRYIFSVDGRVIEAVAELSHEGDYVCSSTVSFKRLDYLKLAREAAENDANNKTQWNRMKRETYYLGGSNTKRDAYKHSGHSKSFGTKNAAAGAATNVGPSGDGSQQFKPRIIAVLRSGMRPRRAVRVLLNHRNTQSLECVFSDLTNLVKLDSGAVRKVFALSSGKPVIAVSDLAEAEVFVAYGSDKCCPQEDFELELAEFKSVQSILKSPELDSKYEKFASQCSQNGSSSVSPRTSRRKFLNSRMPAKSAGPRTKARKASSSKSRQSGSSASESPRPSSKEEEPSIAAQQNGNAAAHHHHHASPQAAYPSNVAAKYVIGDIIGDGNFAVVRRCFGKKTKVEYALKVIDKSKCKNKEHMIESEVHILGSVSHPNIIELVEVFDLPEEKYLVTEYVRGGDLFDAIAADTKYSEDISRGMVRDLVSALKYLHDRMIVHRDIKPENLLVVNLDRDRLGGPDASKSLKLGDFGLAQVVSEPLFTVCGTPTYVAPEILAETGYGVKVDVWATGVIMYILLVGFPPFSSRTNNQEELFDQILSGLFEFNSPDWDDISYPAKELISWMLQVDPLQRYSAYEILQHPWVKSGSQDIDT